MVRELLSIIVTTYNRDDALAAVLRSLAGQTDPNFEVIVADDGSQQSTALLVETWKGRVGRRLEHVWHEDRGFRAAEIRNRAVLLARGRYVIFLDGDCLARPDFIAQHRTLAEAGYFVAGNRVLLSDAMTKKVLAERLPVERWPLLRWLGVRLTGGVNRLAALLTLPLGPLRLLRKDRWQGVRSCNLAVWRDDLIRVNGFDADYQGWGREDSDLVVRLIRAGVARKDGNFATGVLHLHHREFDRAALPDNDTRLNAVIGADAIRARRGLSSLRADA